ncbi:hypothetical protein EIN_306050 [Entamoeba invadens IP1]|uniref:Uncharacterized protein n=1 Tax=Entamoeba invadens IP1 TaxID=370355 RepID=A0A0A1TYX3_ENTIV|nr:hypothetical protein EIN_306050 [Entamoeba invadens IP1]ELP86709.1 hypothetical protein EIN_306050 [Entamoeba invadens IP1]|eukprot:XP_004186055.1 hypothetical protein EIN_306050 [Entamoeba invadens IP1]
MVEIFEEYNKIVPITLQPIANKKLVHVVYITRHGDRLPFFFNLLPQNIQKNKKTGDLTERGKEQMKDAGTSFQQYLSHYPNEFSNLKLQNIKIRSTKIQRTVDSAVAFFKGFFKKDFQTISSFFPDIVEHKENENMTFERDGELSKVVMQNIKTSNKIFEKNEKYIFLEKKFCEIFSQPFSLHKFSSKIFCLGDFFLFYKTHEIFDKSVCEKVEEFTDEEMIETVNSQIEWFYLRLGDDVSTRNMAKPFVFDVINDVQNSLNKKDDVMYHHYSGHDITLLLVLACCGIKCDKVINLGAYLLIEFFEEEDGEIVLRFSFNSKVVKLPCGAGNDFCNFKSFIDFASQSVLREFTII